MSSPQNAASETLHYHVTLYREGFGDSEDVFTMTYQHAEVAVNSVKYWVLFNERLLALNFDDGAYEGMDQYEMLPRETLQSLPETWHDKSLYEIRIEHPWRD